MFHVYILLFTIQAFDPIIFLYPLPVLIGAFGPTPGDSRKIEFKQPSQLLTFLFVNEPALTQLL